MPDFRRFLSRRRLLAVLGVAALLFGLAMLHPYPRQSLFGPTIRGKPWCVWEDAIRRQFNERPESMIDRVQRWLGVRRERIRLEEFDEPEILPLVIALLDDPDAQTRGICMSVIITFPSLQDQSALPALRKRFNDDEFELRLAAGHAIWRIDKDKEVLSVFLKLLDDGDPNTRSLAMREVASISADAPGLYPHIVGHAQDANPSVRSQVMYAMAHFGKKGIPTLIGGMKDADPNVRGSALAIVEHAGENGKETVPVLESLLADVDAGVASQARVAIQRIDPERFRTLKAMGKIE